MLRHGVIRTEPAVGPLSAPAVTGARFGEQLVRRDGIELFRGGLLPDRQGFLLLENIGFHGELQLFELLEHPVDLGCVEHNVPPFIKRPGKA